MLNHLLTQGLLLAWAIMFFDVWEKACPLYLDAIKSILERMLVEVKPQKRWTKGVAAVMLANTMV